MNTTGPDYRLDDETAMLELGAAAGRVTVASGPVIVHLEGPLGAGKTTFARGFLRGAGYQGRVKSPTYTLMEPYSVESGEIVHLDLYRLADPEELEFLGLRDMSGGTVTLLIEWPEKGRGHLPPADISCRIAYAGNGRQLHLEEGTVKGRDWMTVFQADTALQ
jgi:tRNA threonylcarbamoyladenosine biosynthesis protein TsaE